MTLTIANGKVFVNGSLESKNIVIENGKIVEISNNVSGEKINAEGKVVLPGLIDCHVHLREPGLTEKEDFKTGTMAAAAGGVTTVLEMPNTDPAVTTIKILDTKREIAKEKAVVNYGFWFGATNDNLDEIKKIKGVAGIKVYMGSSTGNMLVDNKEKIKNIFNIGKTVIVHAENEALMQKNAEKYKKENGSVIHAKIRNGETEYTAVREAVSIAESCDNLKRLHLTHTSTKESLEIIKEAKGKINLSCDVTPHHLFLDYEELKKQGNFVKMNPALRGKEDVEALWEGINDGTVDCIGTDHAPHTIDEKEADYWEAPAGVPGLETMLPLLLDAVGKGRLTLKKLVELTSENPAKLFGIKNKGKIEVGYDADLVIVDMSKTKEVKNEELFTKCKWSPFNGWKIKGWPITTIVNGEVEKGNEVKFE
jgi:dihydroorotase